MGLYVKGERPRAYLKSFYGVLQADGYAGFEGLYQTGAITEVACWAKNGSRIGALYAIETDIRGRPPESRRLVRQARRWPALSRYLDDGRLEISLRSFLRRD